jgi:hypothetical protein
MKKAITVSMILVLFVCSCSTFRYKDDAGAMTYQPSQYIGKIYRSGITYSPFGLPFVALFGETTINGYREEGYKMAGKLGVAKEDVMFVNEKLVGNTTAGWSMFLVSWWTWWILSFGDFEYSAEVISRIPIAK